MKALLTIGIISVTLFSCKKEKTYLHFTEKQLSFVNYTKGQNLKFLDTSSLVQTLTQDQYLREFREQVGLYGKTGAFAEEYELSYYAQNNSALSLYLRLTAKQPYLNLSFASYEIITRPDSLTYTFPTLTINGKVYNEVYTLKMHKNGRYLNNNDTATLFHNKQFGIIQLLFPDGKKIIQVD